MSRVDYEKIAEEIDPIKPEKVEVLRTERAYLPLDHQKYKGIAQSKGYEQGENFSGNRLQRVHYTHEAMIEVIIAEPTITQRELAQRFERTEAWISIVMGSDAFQAALAKRRDDLMDPEFVATIEDRLKGLAQQSLRIISEKLESTRNTDLAVKSLELSSKALGFGARSSPSVQNNNTYVAVLPPKVQDAAEWAASHAKNITPKQLGGSNG